MLLTSKKTSRRQKLLKINVEDGSYWLAVNNRIPIYLLST